MIVGNKTPIIRGRNRRSVSQREREKEALILPSFLWEKQLVCVGTTLDTHKWNEREK